jgi:prophage regulatory protein
MSYRLLRLPGALERIGMRRSTHYVAIQSGTMTPPIRIGERSVAWPEHEIDAIVAARIAGRSTDEIKDLVRRLVSQRSQADVGAAA